MSVFNSLGSNYRRASGIYSLKISPKGSRQQLKKHLRKCYSTQSVYLTYKGREAIALVLKNSDLPIASQVAINGYTCYAVYQAIVVAGLRPVYLDIEKDLLNFTAKQLDRAIEKTPGLKAVIVQNTLGIPCDIRAIKKICDDHKLILIEDLAHSIGLKYATGEEAGTIGQAAALSFSQDKVVDAVSGGSAIFNKTTVVDAGNWRPASLWHRSITHLYPWSTLIIRKTFSVGVGRGMLKIMKILGLLPGPMSGDADHPHFLPEWHSRLALKAYENLPSIIDHRQKIADIYRQLLPSEIQLRHHEGSIYLRFPILVSKPLELISYLKKAHIYIGDRWYDAPIAPKRSLELTDYRTGQCPNADYVAKRMVNLPTHVNVSEDQARAIAGKVKQWLKSA